MLSIFRKITNHAIIKDTFFVTILSVIGKSVGFLVPFFIAAWFGVTSKTDAFFFVYGLILFCANTFALVIESIIVPYIAEIRSKNEDVGKFIGNLFSISGIGIIVLYAFFFLVLKIILPFVTKFDSDSLGLIYKLLIEISPLSLFLVWTSILVGALNAYKRFNLSVVSPLFRAVVCIVVIFVFKESKGVHSVALGYVVGEVVRFVILLGRVVNLKIFRIDLNFKDTSRLLEFLKVSSYQVISMIAMGFNPVVDRVMASWLGEGSVSILYYADKLYYIPVTIMTSGLTVVILSHWSDTFYQEGGRKLISDVEKTIKIAGIIAFLLSLFLIVFSRPLVNFALFRGDFNRENLFQVSIAWTCYLFGVVPYLCRQIYVKAILVVKNTKILMKSAILMNALNIIFNFILMRYFGIAGLALSTSLASVCVLVYLRKQFYQSIEEVL